jgi:phage terminase large subunit-like protein
MSLRSLASALAESLADGGWRAKARPEQLPPTAFTGNGSANGWLLMAGRGFGKTRTGAEWIKELAETNAARHIALVGPTAGDARDVMVEGPSGILAVSSPWCRPEYEPSKRRLTWPNGATASTFSSEEADRLRGPQHDALWADELASWHDPQSTWDMAMFGLRVGAHPRWLITTTPRPIKLLRELLKREGKDVVVTRGSTFENAANLAGPFLDAIRARYEGTRLGRQELNAELLSDTPGALWQLDWLDRDRVDRAPHLVRIVVAVDPAVSTGEGSDETGIIVAGVDEAGHVYVLEDLSGKFGPDEWARRAVAAYHRWSADRIVGEKNNGGDMIESVVRSVERNIPYKAVYASRGKAIRAEPVSALYEQGKVHHVGAGMVALEDQLCNFTTDFDRGRAGYSPDRLDALVWAITELAVKAYEPVAPQFGVYGRGPSNYLGGQTGGASASAPFARTPDSAAYSSSPDGFRNMLHDMEEIERQRRRGW